MVILWHILKLDEQKTADTHTFSAIIANDISNVTTQCR